MLSVSVEGGQRALHAEGAAAGEVGVDHRGAHVLVAEEGLDGADVVAGLEQVGREAVAEGVRRDALVDAGSAGGAAELALNQGLVEVMTARPARRAVDVGPGGRKEPLPGPGALRPRSLTARA